MARSALSAQPVGRRGLLHRLVQAPTHVVIIVIAALWFVPSLGLFISSLRPFDLIAGSGWWTALSPPFRFTLANYGHVLATAGMGRSFFNSLMIAIPATVMPILVAGFAAYAFSWMHFPGRDALFLVVVGLLVVPLQMTLIPILRLFNRLHLTGTFPGIWIAHSAYGLPFSIYLLRNFIGDLPGELFESAQLDVASHFQMFYRLVLPTSVPALASLAIFQFIWVWNDLLIALIYLGGTPNVAPMTVTISNMVNSYGGDWQYLTAAAFVSMVLPLVVFFSLQRYFIRGILTGAVKG
jgi:alpha-glucoside transport system permease protein